MFEDKYEKSNLDKYQDSINTYNSILSDLLSNPEFSNLKNSDLRMITRLTEIKISNSKDKKIRIISWCIPNPYPTSPMCSNIIAISNKKSKTISLNGTGNRDFGDNIQNDTIIEVLLNDKVYYILTGSNKCGNLCIQSIASIYTISNGDIVKCPNAFFDGSSYSDDVEFDYLINQEIKSAPIFYVKNAELVCPVFNEDKTKQIASKRYKMLQKE